MPLLDDDARPLPRVLELPAVDPPHVLARRVHQLELEVVDRRVRAQPEHELVVLRQLERQLPARDRVTGAAAEVEVQAQCAARPARVRRDPQLHAIRRVRGPAAGRLEVVQELPRHGLRCRRGAAPRNARGRADQHGERHGTPRCAQLHSFMLPSMMPWM